MDGRAGHARPFGLHAVMHPHSPRVAAVSKVNPTSDPARRPSPGPGRDHVATVRREAMGRAWRWNPTASRERTRPGFLRWPGCTHRHDEECYQ